MSRHLRWLVFIVVLTIFSVWVALPDNEGIHTDTDGDGNPDINLNVHQSLGLDLVGGLRVLLQAELPPGSFTRADLEQTADNVGRRVNGLGLGEATVQVVGADRILVELPGASDCRQAIDTIQQTALLEFVDFSGMSGQSEGLVGRKILTTAQILAQQAETVVEPTPAPEATAEATPEANAESTPEATAEATAEPGAAPAMSEDPCTAISQDVVEENPMPNPLTSQPFQTVITGADLQAAVAQYGETGRSAQASWYIQFQLKPEAADTFGAFTESHVGQPLAIVLDGELVSAPVINSRLDTGGIITGSFTEEEAKQLALQLRSGALPIPLRVESAANVGATLGQESVRLSIEAGIIGVITVLAFMLIYYRVPGLAADLALLVFVAINLAAFKLIPVTLTLPAITGFLISIGTAVDGNILIFERIKEELRAGNDLDLALTRGFDRAWNSIRDSNLSTIVISGILFLFGQTPGASIVSGFAITLALGLVINLFTAIIVTRTFLHLLVIPLRPLLAARSWLLGI
jgi:preprotein translocase subunit SecD